MPEDRQWSPDDPMALPRLHHRPPYHRRSCGRLWCSRSLALKDSMMASFSVHAARLAALRRGPPRITSHSCSSFDQKGPADRMMGRILPGSATLPSWVGLGLAAPLPAPGSYRCRPVTHARVVDAPARSTATPLAAAGSVRQIPN